MEEKRKKIEENYLSINIVKNKLRIKMENEYEEKNIYTFIGTDLNGNRSILDIKIDRNDNRLFLDIFETLKAKGVKAIYFVISPDEERIIRGLKISYCNTVFIESLTSNLINVLRWISYRSKYSVSSKLKQFYIQDDNEKALELVEYLKKDYIDNKLMLNLLDKYFGNVTSYYKYDKTIREFLFNHRAMTEIYFKIKTIDTIGIDSVKSEIYDKIKYIEISKSYNKKEWLNIVNHCCDYFNDLLEKVAVKI